MWGWVSTRFVVGWASDLGGVGLGPWFLQKTVRVDVRVLKC
jgi:hypothetical protein